MTAWPKPTSSARATPLRFDRRGEHRYGADWIANHAPTVKRLLRHFERAVANTAVASIQDPVRLDANNEPQPDLAMLRHRDDCYRHANPRSEDVLLIAEVADASTRYDREVKLPLDASSARSFK